MNGDGRALVLAAAATAGALVPARGSLSIGVALLAATALLRWPVLRWLAVALLASGMSQRSLDGLDGVTPALVAGELTLLSDPRPHFEGVRVDVRWGHRRLEARARGASADALRQRLAGEVVTVRGTVRPVEPGRPWLVARHISGELSVLRVDAWRAGDPAGRVANGLRRTLVEGAAPLHPRARSLFTGLVLGDDREQPADLADAFRGAGLTHLLAVSGQNVAFALALAGPLLRRLRLWPRLGATLVVIGLFGVMTRFEPSVLRASAMAALAATLAMPGAPISRLRVVGLAVTALVLIDPLLVRSTGFQLSVCAAVAIVVLAPRLASILPGPAGLREAAGVTLAAQLGVAPVLLATFGPVPVASLPANLLCVPVAGLVMVWGLTGGLVAGVGGNAGGRARCTSRPAWPSVGWSSSPSAPPTRRSASCTSTRSWRWQEGSRPSLWPGRARGSAAWAAQSRSARSLSAVVAAHAPAPLRDPVAPGVVRWHVDDVDVVVLGGAGGRSTLTAPTVLESLRRSGVGTIDLLVVADASVPASVVELVQRCAPGGRDARARGRRRDDRPRLAGGPHRVGARPSRRRRATERAVMASRSAAVGSAPVEPLPWTVVWQVPCPTVSLGPHRFDVRHRALVMGILNRTPDSFFDQGAYFDFDGFLAKAEQLVDEGADFLDVGGVKAGPGPEVDEAEELERVVPALEALSARFDVPVSVDTWRASVLREALAAGAVVGNDISGFADPEYLPVAAAAGASVVATHIRIGPRVPDPEPVYDEPVVDAVGALPAGAGRGRRGGRDPPRTGDGGRRPRPRQERAAVARAAARPRPARRSGLATVPVGVEQAVPGRPRRHHGGRSARRQPRRPRPRDRPRQQDPARPRRPRRPANRRRDGRRARRARRGERMTDTSGSPPIPVTLLKGDDEVVLRDAVRLLVDDLVGAEDRALMVEEVDVGPPADDGDPLLSLVDAAQTPPLFTDVRVVLGRITEKRERGELVQPLVDYLQDPLPSSRLILEWRGKVPKALTEAITHIGGSVVDTSPGRKVGEWVAEHLADAGLKVDTEGRSRLVTWVGDEPSRLLGLLDLLRSTYGTGARLTASDIEPFLGDDGGVPPWDLTDAIDRGERAAALELLQRMIGQGDRAPVPGARHAPLPLRPDAPPRRGGGHRGEGGGRAARPQGLHVPGQEGARPDPSPRPRASGASDRPARRGRPRPARGQGVARPPRARGARGPPGHDVPMTDGAPGDTWNHNIHYQKVLLEAVPDGCRSALDVGCGQGFLLRPLAERAGVVVGIDQDAPSLAEAAERTAASANVQLVEGDVMTHPFGQPFDAVLSIAVLHHLPLKAGLQRMKELTAPGGVVGVVGLAKSRSPHDYARDGIGVVETRLRRLRRSHTMVTAPICDPEETYREVRTLARDVLPGVRFRRHNLFRYSLVWTRPPR